MTLQQNKTPFFAYLVIAILAFAAIITVGIVYHTHTYWYHWLFAGVGIAAGFGIMGYQVKTGGDTTAIGYWVQFGTAVAFCIWVVGSIPAV